MKIKPKQYAIAFYEAVKDLPKPKAEEFSKKFVKLLAADNALGMSGRILQYLTEYANSQEEAVDLKIKTAQPIKEESAETIRKEAPRLLGKQFKKANIMKELDPALIGGFVLECGDTVFDASLKNRLRILRNNLFIK